MIAKIKQQIAEKLRQAGVTSEVALSIPPKPEMGDFAFACFGLAKEQGKNPAEAAKLLESKVQSPKSKVIERVEAFGPYVNFFLNGSKLAEQVIKQIAKDKEKYGKNKNGQEKEVMIEYPSNNTHKEFHIGHFRNVCIGNALVQIFAQNGFKVYPVNYLNDFGAHVAKCLWGLNKFHAGEVAPANKQKWLGGIYVEASKYIKDHLEVAGEVGEVQRKLEARDKTIWPLFEKTRMWSIKKFDELFKELGVKHVAVFYEKDIKNEAQKIVDELLKKKIAEVGEGGAIIINLEKYGLDIALIRKSNGVGLYMTSDLPLAKKKFKKYKVDESIIITGQEQTFYFKQLYRVLELMGFKKKMTHIGYGLVNSAGGKMSSRLGNVVLYEDLRDEVKELLTKGTQERHADWPEKKINYTVNKLTFAALKFDMQKHEALKNIVFDIKEATSFEGFSGPYVLYVVARINSLMRKAGVKFKATGIKYNLLTTQEEKKLALLLAEYEEVIKKALEQYNPSVIARYCFDLAQGFNEFYNKCSILNAGSNNLIKARLALSLAVKNALTNALNLLTIETVAEM